MIFHSHHGITAFSCNMTCFLLISALDITPPDCWLNKHKMGGTSGVSKSKSDWLDSTGNKAVVTSKSSKEKKAVVITVTMIAYQDQNAGFSNACEVLSTIVAVNLYNNPEWIVLRPVIVGTLTFFFYAHKHDTEQNELWAVALYVSQTSSWAELGQ